MIEAVKPEELPQGLPGDHQGLQALLLQAEGHAGQHLEGIRRRREPANQHHRRS